MEEEKTSGISATDGTQETNPIVEQTEVVPTEQTEVVPTEQTEKETPKLTQEEVNALVVERLKKQKETFLKKYGVDDETKLDELVDKAKLHDEMKEQLETLKSSNASLTEKLAFIENNINPERYEDIRIYFKGKGEEFTPENLLKALSTHKEWMNTIVPTTVDMGAKKPKPQTVDEKKKGLNLFGV